MEYRRLGRSGMKVSEVSLGTWQTFGGKVDEAAAGEIVRTSYDAGINFFDTADVYRRGEAEVCLGKALRELPRDTYVLATKVRGKMGDWPTQVGLSRKHIFDAIDASLKRLGVEYVDLYQAHHPDEDTPLDETLRAFDDLVKAGKIRYAGVSNFPADQLIQAHGIAEEMGLDKIVSNQPVYNMFRREIEAEVVPASQKLGIGQVVYSPLAQGVLTGKYNAGEVPPESRAAEAKPGTSVHKYLAEERVEKARRIGQIADELGLSMTHLALVWCLRQANVSSVICGASRAEQIAENAAASGKTVPADVLERIEGILAE
jgi:aryl-alcohol dehydrogenase-like predicted oxidoreductase